MTVSEPMGAPAHPEATAATETMTRGTAERQPPGELARREASETVDHFIRMSRAVASGAAELLKKPTSKAAVAGAAVTGAAVMWGLGPPAVAVAAGYVVYRILRRNERHIRAASA